VDTFIVESYWPGVTADAFGKAVARAEGAAKQIAAEGTPVRHLDSILVPQDEAVFHLFEGYSAEVVEQVGRRARLRFARVVRCVRPEDPSPGSDSEATSTVGVRGSAHGGPIASTTEGRKKEP
jgi:hypothetical protein